MLITPHHYHHPLLNMFGNCFWDWVLPHLPSNCSEADHTSSPDSPSWICDICLLPVLGNPSWWPWPFKDHQEWPYSDISWLSQHLWIHPTWCHELVSCLRCSKFSLRFLKASLKMKAKKALCTSAFSMSYATRSSPRLPAGPYFP